MKQKTACNIMIAILTAVLLFHFSVLLQIIDFTKVWGGRLKDTQQMYVFETISICLNLFLLFIILQKVNYVKQIFSIKLINIILWVFVFIFALNTIGNLFATNIVEKILGTVLTLVSGYLCWVIVKKQ